MAEASKETTRVQPLFLDFQSVQKVVVTDKEDDRWLTTVREAAQACRSAEDLKQWQEEFEGFLVHIHEWAKKHADLVMSAFVGTSSEGLTGVIVTKGPEYRHELEDEISDLDIELAKRFPTCRADILQSPDGEPESRIPYISEKWAVQVYGNKN